MAIELRTIKTGDFAKLYQILKEREPHQNISHKELPPFVDHIRFVKSNPYRHWWTVRNDGEFIGSAYITFNNEIGMQLLKGETGKGYGAQAFDLMLNESGPGRYLANINPENEGSQRFFQNKGFKLIQYTYEKTC